MKEIIISKLKKYNYKYLMGKNLIRVKLGHSLVVDIDFSQPEKIKITDRLMSWNFLSGSIEVSIKTAMVINSIGFFVVAVMMAFLENTNQRLGISIYFIFIIFLITIWTFYYLIKAENFKQTVMNWIENARTQ